MCQLSVSAGLRLLLRWLPYCACHTSCKGLARPSGALLRRARAQKEELDRAWWREAAEQGEGPAGAAQAGAPADEAGLDTWQACHAHMIET